MVLYYQKQTKSTINIKDANIQTLNSALHWSMLDKSSFGMMPQNLHIWILG